MNGEKTDSIVGNKSIISKKGKENRIKLRNIKKEVKK